MITNIDIEKNKEQIVNLLRSTHRDGIENVINYLNESGFFYVPSSIRRHHNWKGGLAQHSLGVYLKAHAMHSVENENSLIIAALLHDICKARMLYYDKEGNVHHNDVHIHGHGYRSVRLLDSIGFRLTDDEYAAIRWHMHSRNPKPEDKYELRKARTSKLWLSVHTADKADAKESCLCS